jgi:hypothetical protein
MEVIPPMRVHEPMTYPHQKYIPVLLFSAALSLLLCSEAALLLQLRPPRNLDQFFMSFLPVFALVPALSGFFAWLKIRQLVVKKELSSDAAASINTLLGSLLMMTYLVVMQLAIHVKL